MVKDIEKTKKLAEILQKLETVRKYDSENNQEAWTISITFNDIEESFDKIYNELLPKIIECNHSNEDVDELLFDIGFELNHILYHIKSMRYFTHVIDNEKPDK